MNVLNVPRPGWMTEDLVLLEEQARRFIAAEYVPHLDTWNEEVGTTAKSGTKPAQPGSFARRSLKNTAAPAARSRTKR